MTDPDFILRVLRAFDPFDCHDCLWRAQPDGSVSFYVQCNDLFWWATADLEELTPENIHILEQAVKDVNAITNGRNSLYGNELFCARVRGMRPQKCAYPQYFPEMWPLLDACGPERDDDKTSFPKLRQLEVVN